MAKKVAETEESPDAEMLMRKPVPKKVAAKVDVLNPEKLTEQIRAFSKDQYGVYVSVQTPSMSEKGLFFTEVVSAFEAHGWTLDETATFELRKSEIKAKKGQTDDLYVFIR